MLLVAEAVVFDRELGRTCAILHQRYRAVGAATRGEQFVGLLRPGRGGRTARRPTARRPACRCAARWRAARRRVAWRYAAGRYAAAGAIGVVIAGYSVAVGIQVVGVAGVAVELDLRRFLRAEAGAVVLVGLRHGRLARVDYLLVGATQHETCHEHQPHHYQLPRCFSHPAAHCTLLRMQTILSRHLVRPPWRRATTSMFGKCFWVRSATDEVLIPT